MIVFRSFLALLVATFSLWALSPVVAQDAGTDTGYVLGSGDVVEVSVLGQAEFTTRARVRADGTIVLPFVGSTKVAGETSVTLAKALAATLSKGGYYSNPIVNVEIASYASRYVIVLGSVAQAGLQPVDRAYRLSEIIARAGGIRADGADYVILRRQGGAEMKLPFDKLASGTDADDPYVGPGDKVYVPVAESYYIYGQISAPGAYSVKDQMTLRKAIARGGGLTPTGSEKKISVFRNGQKQPLAMDAPIAPGDVASVCSDNQRFDSRD
jgi:polysaccharide biosynthesis/export protein